MDFHRPKHWYTFSLPLVLLSVHTAWAQVGGAGADIAAPNAPTGEKVTSDENIAPKSERLMEHEFAQRMAQLRDFGDWITLEKSGVEWQNLHPTDANGWYTEGRGAYMQGKISVAIQAWEMAKLKDPSAADIAESWLKSARQVQKNFPNLQLEPLFYTIGEATQKDSKWADEARSLLTTHQYDQIETTAATLQKSNAATVFGKPNLDAFFVGLSSAGDSLDTRQQLLQSWLKAKPASTLARLAQIEMWTNAAWKARGTGWSSTITPAMEKSIDDSLKRAANIIAALGPEPKTPLFYTTLMNWAQLSGAGRPFMDEIYQRGRQKFPNYYPIDLVRARLLLPRWYGEKGEWEAMLEKRANQVGGENGDILYARLVDDSLDYYQNIFTETGASYVRVKRGWAALLKRQPSSISTFNGYLHAAIRDRDWKTAQELLLRPGGNLLDKNTWTIDVAEWAAYRMEIFSENEGS